MLGLGLGLSLGGVGGWMVGGGELEGKEGGVWFETVGVVGWYALWGGQLCLLSHVQYQAYVEMWFLVLASGWECGWC